MDDKLTELFDGWVKGQQDPTVFQAFQGGFSNGASGMRTRAVSVITSTKMDNNVKNALLTAIGSLPDIPKS